MVIDYKNPTKEEQMYLALKSPRECKFIENLDEDVQEYLINKNMFYYQFINNPTISIEARVCEERPHYLYVSKRPDMILGREFHTNLDYYNSLESSRERLRFLSKHFYLYNYIKPISEEELNYLIKRRPKLLQFMNKDDISKIDQDIIMSILKKSKSYIRFIPNPTLEMQEFVLDIDNLVVDSHSLRPDGYNIVVLIEHIDDSLQLKLIKHNSELLPFINHPCLDLLKYVCDTNIKLLRKVKYIDNEVLWGLIDYNVTCIKYLVNKIELPEHMVQYAIAKYPECKKYIESGESKLGSVIANPYNYIHLDFKNRAVRHKADILFRDHIYKLIKTNQEQLLKDLTDGTIVDKYHKTVAMLITDLTNLENIKHGNYNLEKYPFHYQKKNGKFDLKSSICLIQYYLEKYNDVVNSYLNNNDNTNNNENTCDTDNKTMKLNI